MRSQFSSSISTSSLISCYKQVFYRAAFNLFSGPGRGYCPVAFIFHLSLLPYMLSEEHHQLMLSPLFLSTSISEQNHLKFLLRILGTAATHNFF